MLRMTSGKHFKENIRIAYANHIDAWLTTLRCKHKFQFFYIIHIYIYSSQINVELPHSVLPVCVFDHAFNITGSLISFSRLLNCSSSIWLLSFHAMVWNRIVFTQKKDEEKMHQTSFFYSAKFSELFKLEIHSAQ